MKLEHLLFWSNEVESGLEIASQAMDAMRTWCGKNPGFETGGILVGEYSRDGRRAFIRDALGPTADSQSTRWTFVRGTEGLRSELRRRWRRDRHHYVGEWHYHPYAAPTPSAQDVEQIRRVAADPRYYCTEPILLIVGGDPFRDRTVLASVFSLRLGRLIGFSASLQLP